MQSEKRKVRQQPQPTCADHAEISTDIDIGKDFSTLINAPLSKGGHFVFKSEKDWSAVDCSSEFFTLNLNILSAAINCIPFNEYIDVDDRYFTNDQLTSICNDAEKGRAAYNDILNTSCAVSSSSSASLPLDDEPVDSNRSKKSTSTTDEKPPPAENDVSNLEDDIDFLLSLTEPIQSNVAAIAQSFPKAQNCDTKQKVESNPTKPVDLEKWLDSVLDD